MDCLGDFKVACASPSSVEQLDIDDYDLCDDLVSDGEVWQRNFVAFTVGYTLFKLSNWICTSIWTTLLRCVTCWLRVMCSGRWT